jgi:hypothetical protein
MKSDKTRYFNFGNDMFDTPERTVQDYPESDYIPKVGHKFTISNNLVTGDRSYTSQVIVCTGVNESHVQGLVDSIGRDEKKKTLFDKSEHKFYPADDL